MSLSKIFNVVVNFGGLPPHRMHEASQQVEQDIAALAKRENAPVSFHVFKDADLLGGGSSVLIETTDEFAEKVKSIKNVVALDKPHLPTTPRI